MHTFLVVDDDAIIRRVLRTVLEKNGDRILEAANGVEALAILRDFAVNLILSDLLMP
ncbi:MAG: response regulator [Anaerolineales bacterium]|nr:response regulator [Anaerolineales bacterium]